MTKLFGTIDPETLASGLWAMAEALLGPWPDQANRWRVVLDPRRPAPEGTREQVQERLARSTQARQRGVCV